VSKRSTVEDVFAPRMRIKKQPPPAKSAQFCPHETFVRENQRHASENWAKYTNFATGKQTDYLYTFS
jgi:hypothetical protein